MTLVNTLAFRVIESVRCVHESEDGKACNVHVTHSTTHPLNTSCGFTNTRLSRAVLKLRVGVFTGLCIFVLSI